MNRTVRALAAFSVIAAVAFTVAAVSRDQGSTVAARGRAGHASASEDSARLVAARSFPIVDPIEEARTIYDYQVAVYVAAVAEQQRVADYIAAVIAEQEREAEAAREAAARESARAATMTVTSSGAESSGGCRVGACSHSDAWWTGVAICEQGRNGQPYNDPFFGYFSFMDGSQGGRPWSEQVAAGNALLNSVGHEVGPWAAACVAAGYAASPSG